MKKPKHIGTKPIYGNFTGKRIGTAFIYDDEEIKSYKKHKDDERRR